MQRYPTRNLPARQAGPEEGEISPVLRLARRIREEQGPEQVKAFIAAMRPFAAPNELRRIGESFGIDYDSIPPEPLKAQEPERRSESRSSGPADQLRMIQTLMQLMGAAKGGADPIKLMGMMRN